MASGYDVTIKLYQHHMIERVTRAVDAINVRTYLMYFVVVTLSFQLLAKHGLAAFPCKQFVKNHP